MPPRLLCGKSKPLASAKKLLDRVSLHFEASILGMMKFFWAPAHHVYPFLTPGGQSSHGDCPQPLPLRGGRGNVPPRSELHLGIPDKPARWDRRRARMSKWGGTELAGV